MRGCDTCSLHPLLLNPQLADYETMARALATIGACDVDVDFKAFSRDLEAFFAELEQVNTTVVVSGDRAGACPISWLWGGPPIISFLQQGSVTFCSITCACGHRADGPALCFNVFGLVYSLL